ncbi:MAG TPA: ribulose-phosphate 3-epimerase [Candidatus Limnocylindria bacterium]|nr:ribulose-phosphate 3-epimerase [Candidatus Limnocylindria bacterium]
MVDIAPSVLAAHPLHVHRDVSRLVEAGASILHLDIMDGDFVPNISFGPAMVKALRDAFPSLRLDVHLMLSRPDRLLDAFVKAGADEITVHIEAQCDLRKVIRDLSDAGVVPGLSIKPGTEVHAVSPYFPDIGLVLVMSVEPGFGGQPLMRETLDKIPELRGAGFTGTVSVDGGVNADNCAWVASLGATRLVMGTAAFTAADPVELFNRCRGL